MDILYLLVPLSVVLVFVIGFFFRWSLKGGQFEDLEGPGYRILMDDDGPGKDVVEAPEDKDAKSAGNEPRI
jgi:cbb3-type cytochrome oxidase maturation protein